MPPNNPGSLSVRTTLRAWFLLLLFLCATTALLTLPHPTEAVSNQGLVGYWSFNEGTGSVAGDFSGNRNTGTPVPTWTNGKALRFDGSTAQMVYVNSSAFLSPSSAITASAWFRRIGTSGTQAQILASRWGLANSYALYYRDDTDQMALSVAGLSGSPVLATASIEDAQWHHAVGTYDGSNLRLYLDGVLIGSPLPATGSITDNGEPLQIGYEADGFGASPFNGDIDEVRIYNRALSATEIAKLYGFGAVKFTTSSVNLQQGSTLANGLVGHWTFDGPDVTDKVYDRSGQNNHGYFIGGATSSAKVIGKLGQALTFDGTGQHVNIADDPSLAVSTITVSGWVKTRTLMAEGPFSIGERREMWEDSRWRQELRVCGIGMRT
jgi:Concanavalin A-like lectin/glucanases superfamily